RGDVFEGKDEWPGYPPARADRYPNVHSRVQEGIAAPSALSAAGAMFPMSTGDVSREHVEPRSSYVHPVDIMSRPPYRCATQRRDEEINTWLFTTYRSNAAHCLQACLALPWHPPSRRAARPARARSSPRSPSAT